MSERVTFEVLQGKARADLRLDDCETVDDLEAAVGQAVGDGRRKLVLDLRSVHHPHPVALPMALEAAVAQLGSRTNLHCLVASAHVAESLRGHVHPPESALRGFHVGERKVDVLLGDIVAVRADAVVNASNTQLRLGSGVSGALRRACGESLQPAMSAHAPVEPGGLAETDAFELKTTSRILHVATVSGLPADVQRALHNILAHCVAHSIESVALPALGTGSGGLPIDQCAALFAEALGAHSGTHPSLIRIVAWSQQDFDAFLAAFEADQRFRKG